MNQRIIFALMVFAMLGGFFLYYAKIVQTKIPEQPKIFFAKNIAYDFYSKEDLEKLYKSLSSKDFHGESDFQKQPYIEKGIFSRSLTGQPVIKVYLQQPVMAFFTKGAYKLLDKTGAVFSEVPQYRIPDLPIIKGELFLAKKNRLKAIEIFLKLNKEGLLSQNTLSEVLYGEDLELIFSGVNSRVFIGETEISNRVDRVSKVIKYLRFHGIEAHKIDARFADRVVVSLKKDLS